MKVLSVSDVEAGIIYSPQIRDRFTGIEMAISCGDLPYYYLEYIIDMLDVPMYYVLGNHANQEEISNEGSRYSPWGGINLHRKVFYDRHLIMAGIEGSVRYNNGPHQYNQREMWLAVWSLVPKLFFQHMRYGRYLDIFITHAPPWGIHDADDPPHRGIKAFNWLIKVFQPRYHFHGHTHIYRADAIKETRVVETLVINTCGYREIDLEVVNSIRRK